MTRIAILICVVVACGTAYGSNTDASIKPVVVQNDMLVRVDAASPGAALSVVVKQAPAPGALMNFVLANQTALWSLAGYFLICLLNYAKKYPKGRGVVAGFWHLIDIMACVQHRDSPPKLNLPGILGALNLPMALSNHPEDMKTVDEVAATPPKVAAVIAPLLFICALSALSGCAGNMYQDAYRVVTGARYAATITAQGLTQYDAQHQQALVNDAKAQCRLRQVKPADVSVVITIIENAEQIACQKDLGKQLLMDWDAKVKRIQLARDSVRTALDVAEMAISVAEKAKSGVVTLHSVTDPLGKVIKDLATVLTEAGVPPIYAAALTALGGI